MWASRYLFIVLLLFVSPAAGQDLCGTIDTTGATIKTGSAPTAGSVTIEPCGGPGSLPSVPPLGTLGTIGSMTGSLPSFPGGGDGSGGEFHATTDQTLDGGTYNYSSYRVDNMVTVTYRGPVTVLVTGDANVEGWVTTDADGASITIRCGGTFNITGGIQRAAEVHTLGAASPIEVSAGLDVTGSTRGRIEAEHGDVSVTAHGLTAGTGRITLDGGTIYSRDGFATLRAAGDVSFARAQADGETGLLVQSFGGGVTVTSGSDLGCGDGTSARVESSSGIVVDGSSYVEVWASALWLTAFGGDVVLGDCTVGTSSGNVSVRASESLKVLEYGIVSAEEGNLTLTAFGADVEIASARVDTDSGVCEVKAARSVTVSGDARVHSDAGEVRVRALGENFELHDDAVVGRGSRDHGPIDVRASGGIVATTVEGEAHIHGSTVSLSSGTGGVRLALDYVRAQAGALTIVSAGKVNLAGPLEAHGNLTVQSLGDVVGFADATLTTPDREDTPSGSILVESWAGPAGLIDGRNATVTTGGCPSASGDIAIRVRWAENAPEPVEPTEAFILPKRVLVKLKQKKPEKSKIIVAGFFDLGPEAVDLTAAARLEVGGEVVQVAGLTPVRNGKLYRYKTEGMVFTIKPARWGSSRAKFKLKMVKDLSNTVNPEDILNMRFVCDVMDGRGAVLLTRGKYALRRVRGALVEPNLHLAKVKARLKGAGKDKLSLLLGLATQGVTPAEASDLTLRFGNSFQVTVPADSFTRKGDRYEFRGDAGGVTRVVLDYRKETIKIRGKGLSLGAFAQGGNSVPVTVGLGADERAVRVRMARKGSSLRY